MIALVVGTIKVKNIGQFYFKETDKYLIILSEFGDCSLKIDDCHLYQPKKNVNFPIFVFLWWNFNASNCCIKKYGFFRLFEVLNLQKNHFFFLKICTFWKWFFINFCYIWWNFDAFNWCSSKRIFTNNFMFWIFNNF